MKLMQLVKKVLDEAYGEIEYLGDRDAAIRGEIDEMIKEYREGLVDDGQPAIDYSGDARRFAYLYKYTVAHADYIMQLIGLTKAIQHVLSRKEGITRVACLGGGPGSDFLGILKWMLKNNVDGVTLHCELYDKEPAWANTWSDVVPLLGSVPFGFSTAFMPMDVTQPATWEHYRKLDKADLYTLSYFVSEVWKFRTQAEAFFSYCFSRMKPGSHILFVDNDAECFTAWFDALTARHNLETVFTGSTELAFSNEEEKNDLGEHFSKFGWPKRKSRAAYRVLLKR